MHSDVTLPAARLLTQQHFPCTATLPSTVSHRFVSSYWDMPHETTIPMIIDRMQDRAH